MKIAIFGDSFADVDAAVDFSWNKSTLLEKSWYYLLSKKYTIENYAKSGSGLYYSYNHFIKNHEKYDRVIFLVTAYGRLHLSSIDKHVSGYDHIVRCLNVNDKHRSIYKTALDYITYIQNDDEVKTYHKLMIDNIYRIRPDALLIPCFDKHRSLLNTDFSLHNISMIDIDHYNLDDKWPGYDKRPCHMNFENNVILSEKIEYWINTGSFDINPTDFLSSCADKKVYFNIDENR